MRVRGVAALALAGAAMLPVAASAAAAGDARAGEAVYARCQACHALAYDRTGPRHCGLIGRRAGTVAGFDYSAAMQRSLVAGWWTERHLSSIRLDLLTISPSTTPMDVAR